MSYDEKLAGRIIDDQADEIERLGKLTLELNRRLVMAESQLTSVVHVVGGTIEGHPTGRHNVLQRIRELLALEETYMAIGQKRAGAGETEPEATIVRLLQSSSCFGFPCDVPGRTSGICATLPCACAESIATAVIQLALDEQGRQPWGAS